MQMSCLTGLKNPFTSVEMFSLPGPSLFLHWGGGIQLGVSMRKKPKSNKFVNCGKECPHFGNKAYS